MKDSEKLTLRFCLVHGLQRTPTETGRSILLFGTLRHLLSQPLNSVRHVIGIRNFIERLNI